MIFYDESKTHPNRDQKAKPRTFWTKNLWTNHSKVVVCKILRFTIKIKSIWSIYYIMYNMEIEDFFNTFTDKIRCVARQLNGVRISDSHLARIPYGAV